MKRTHLEWYILAICFVSILAFVGTVGVSIYSAVRVAMPDFTMSAAEFERYQSNDAFWDFCIQDRTCSDEDEDRPDEEVLQDLRQEWLERGMTIEQRAGAQLFVKSLIALLIEIITFIIHWVFGQRLRAAKEPNPDETQDADKKEKQK